MTTHLYMLVLQSAFIQRMFNTTNLNYEEIIKSLNIKNRRLILELELENDDRSLLELLHNTSQIVEERSENDTESAANNPNSRAQERTIEHNNHVIMEQNQGGGLRPVKPRLIPDELSEGDTRSTRSRKDKMQTTRKMFESPLGYGKGVKSVSPEHPRRRAVDESMREYGNKRDSQRGSEISRREVLSTDQDLPKKTETSVSNNLSVYQNPFFGRRIRKESGNSNKSNREVAGYGNESNAVKSGERNDTQETFQKSSKPSQFVVVHSKASERSERLSNKSSDKQRVESASVAEKEKTERLSNKNNTQRIVQEKREMSRGSTKREEIQVTKRISSVRKTTEEDKKSEVLELPSSTKRTQERKGGIEGKSEVKVSAKSSRRESEPKSKKLQSQKSQQSEEYADDFEEMDFDDES